MAKVLEMTKKKKTKDQYKFEHNKDWRSRLARLEKKRKKNPDITNDRDHPVFNTQHDGKSLNHFKNPPAWAIKEAKELKDKNKIIAKSP